jgi:sigma-B regulation protein RsbU (phosphoserine phosphatase)
MDAPAVARRPKKLCRGSEQLLHYEIDGARVEAVYRPADEVGGDLYEIGSPGLGRLRVVIGDTCGRGAQAAHWVERLRPAVQKVVSCFVDPERAVERLNEQLCELLPDDVFVTLALLDLDVSTGMLGSVNAGHVPPLVRPADSPAACFGLASGPPLGVLSGARYTRMTMQLVPGDIVLAMTDGVLESIDEDLLSMPNLLRLLDTREISSLADIRRRIWGEATRDSPRIDDLTWVGLELTGTLFRRSLH